MELQLIDISLFESLAIAFYEVLFGIVDKQALAQDYTQRL